jgi:hypothetical protein
MFEAIERMPLFEGYKAEIVEGAVVMSPHRHVHARIMRLIMRALEDEFGMDDWCRSTSASTSPGT